MPLEKIFFAYATLCSSCNQVMPAKTEMYQVMNDHLCFCLSCTDKVRDPPTKTASNINVSQHKVKSMACDKCDGILNVTPILSCFICNQDISYKNILQKSCGDCGYRDNPKNIMCDQCQYSQSKQYDDLQSIDWKLCGCGRILLFMKNEFKDDTVCCMECNQVIPKLGMMYLCEFGIHCQDNFCYCKLCGDKLKSDTIYTDQYKAKGPNPWSGYNPQFGRMITNLC